MCKKIYLKGCVSSYISGNGIINQNKSIRLLKRISCKGCDGCNWFWTVINDIILKDNKVLSTIEHNKIYTPEPIYADKKKSIIIGIEFKEIILEKGQK